MNQWSAWHGLKHHVLSAKGQGMAYASQYVDAGNNAAPYNLTTLERYIL
jgi:hypothetical protein